MGQMSPLEKITMATSRKKSNGAGRKKSVTKFSKVVTFLKKVATFLKAREPLSYKREYARMERVFGFLASL